VWDAVRGVQLAVLRGHEDWVTSVAYSPDSRQIASGSGGIGTTDNTVRIWDAESGAELAVLRGHKMVVWSVSYRPDGQRIVSGSSDETLRLWDAVTGVELAILHGHDSGVTCVSYSPDGQRLVVGGGLLHSGTLRVVDVESGDELAVLRGHDTGVTSVAYSPDGRRIASGGGSGKRVLRVWDAQTGECLEVIEGSGDVTAIAAGASSGLSLRAIGRGEQTVIEPVDGGEYVARFPTPLEHITTHPNGRSWAGSLLSQFYIITLEDISQRERVSNSDGVLDRSAEPELRT